MPPPYKVIRTQPFLDQVQEAYDWLLETNFEQTGDIELSEKRAKVLLAEVNKVASRLETNPNIGTLQANKILRAHPVHGGRYSLVWLFAGTDVNLLGFPDNKNPAELRYLMEDDE